MFVSKARSLPEGISLQVLHTSVFCWAYPQTLDYVRKVSHGQTLQLITKIRKLRTKKFYNIGPRACLLDLRDLCRAKDENYRDILDHLGSQIQVSVLCQISSSPNKLECSYFD
jgi:hypothetical protein